MAAISSLRQSGREILPVSRHEHCAHLADHTCRWAFLGCNRCSRVTTTSVFFEYLRQQNLARYARWRVVEGTSKLDLLSRNFLPPFHRYVDITALNNAHASIEIGSSNRKTNLPSGGEHS
jgi:hypothetical protein